MKLNFSLKNTNPVAKGSAVVYRNTDPSFNTLELTITNDGEDLDLKGGVPVREGTIQHGGATTMYMDAATVLACGLTALGQMEVKSAGYNTRFFDDAGGTWALSPKEDGKLTAGETIKITISNIVVGADALTGHTSLDYYNFSGSEGEVVSMAVQVADKPAVGNKDLTSALAMSWGNNGYQDIYATIDPNKPFSNELSFTLRNNDASSIAAGPGTEFTLSFVYANIPGYGALCTKQEGNGILIKQAYSLNPWSGGKDRLSPAPIWRFTPNGKVLGTGENATTSFSISELISTLQPGPTLMYLSWVNVPGYNDGQKSLGITKLSPPVISLFTATPPALVFDLPSETKDVEIEWQVDHWDGRLVEINGAPVAAKGKKNFPVQYHDGGEKMELSVIFGDNKHVAQRDCTIGTALRGPVVKKLETNIKLLDFRKQASVEVKVSWAVDHARQVTFSGDYISGVQPATGSVACTIPFHDMAPLKAYEDIPGVLLELVAEGYSAGERVAKSVPLFQWASQMVFPNLKDTLKILLKAKNSIIGQEFRFLSDLYLVVNNISSLMGGYSDNCAPVKSLVALILATKKVVDNDGPDWAHIKRYAALPDYMIQQIGDLGTYKDSWQRRVTMIGNGIAKASVRKQIVDRIGYEDSNVVFLVAKGYCRFLETLYLKPDGIDTLHKLTGQLNALVADKSPESARKVLATCKCMAGFIYDIDKLPRNRR